MRDDRMQTVLACYIRLVTILGNAIRAGAAYFTGMNMPITSASNGQSGHMPALHGRYPVRYHRSISLGAWVALVASGAACWAFILSSI